jgi:hypothetical protein
VSLEKGEETGRREAKKPFIEVAKKPVTTLRNFSGKL